MLLDAILKLRPSPGAPAADIAAVLGVAEAKRNELLDTAREADRLRGGNVLEIDDKTLAAAETAAAKSRLAVARIDALLPQIRNDLETARARETLAELRAGGAEVNARVAALERWQREDLPRILELARIGLAAEGEAKAAHADFLARVDVAFRGQAVRDEAPDGLGADVSPLPARQTLPTAWFGFWGFPR